MRPQFGPDLVVNSFTKSVAGAVLLLAGLSIPTQAAPPQEAQTVTPIEELDAGTTPVAGKVSQDTIWIADWSFDAPDGSCTSEGWVVYDNRILNDGSNYWQVTTDFAGGGGGTITGSAAALRHQDPCAGSFCEAYGIHWDYSIILAYSGSTATLSFKFISNTEGGFDFVKVEADSLGLSESLVDYALDPVVTPVQFRDELFTADGDNSAGVFVGPLALPNYGPGMHQVYIRFVSDGAVAADFCIPPFISAALVVDDIAVTGGTAYTENFSCGAIPCLNPNVQLLNTAVATPFGSWARLYKHITDNDKCNENTTCAWLWTDPTRLAFFSDMAFGPGGAVIRNWLDNIIVSPWTSLASTPGSGTILSFRRFGGNRFTQGSVVQGWRVRGRTRIENTDTSSSGDSIDCVSGWGHASMFNSLTSFVWVTNIFDATPYFASASRDVQFSFRVSDWRYLTGAPWSHLNTGPGPYLDRVRIGRRILSGPVFDLGSDTRFQAQDNFPSSVNAITPGEHHAPTTDRFGTCDFRQGTDQGTNLTSTQVVSGDSITANVLDLRSAGGITAVKWYGSIANGPHAGKAPAPYTVGSDGFFEVTAEMSRDANGAVVANRWYVDLDDTYMRGGDELLYFWYATDSGGGASSAPAGIGMALPASIEAAEAATGGLFTMSALPAIDWSASYLQRIANDPHGDLEPTPEELQASEQRHCILYYQHATSNRRSGILNRTSFMVTLEHLGYDNGGDYEVFDVQGYGNTNNQLASRATVEQCTGYVLIIEDDGRSNLSPNIPDGGNTDNEKVRQATFYRNWLDAGMLSEAGRATLWILGESTVAEFPNALFTTYCGVGAVVQDQGLSVNPDVVGQTSFTFAPSNCTTSFAEDVFSLNGGCPAIRNYDGFTAGGTAVATHRYRSGVMLGHAAVLMNARPATNANTIVMGFNWADMRSPLCVPPGCPNPNPSAPSRSLAARILACTVPTTCVYIMGPVDVPEGDRLDGPLVSALHPNVPNPFNPTTTIAFDLARAGYVRLEVFDVGGRSVRVLVDEVRPAGRNHRVVWDGLDAAGARASSGVYFYRLVAGDLTATRKMIVVK